MSEYATTDDVNSVGKRINRIAETQAAHAALIGTCKDNITELWKKYNEHEKELNAMMLKIGIILGIGMALTFVVSAAGLILQLSR